MLKEEIIKEDKQLNHLQLQAHIDLTQRSKGGIIIYFVVWLITAIWGEIYRINPTFFIINTTLLLIIAALRSVHYVIVLKKGQANNKKLYTALIILILMGAFHWGIMSAMVIYNGDYPKLHYPYMILIASFAIGGTSVLSISKVISIFYPLLMFVPTLIVVGGIVGGSENHVLMVLALLSVLYVLETSRIAHNDYHQAIYSHRVAENRATEMEKLSITDPLTSLKNRLYFNEQYSFMWDYCRRHRTYLSLIMLDLDYFKKINDTFGHLVGDECLVKVSDVLSHEIRRSTDTVARFGGEEFIVLLPETELQIADKIAQKILKGVSEIEYQIDNQSIKINCSIGVACAIPTAENSKRELIVLADDALYQAKTNGRNQCFVAKELSNNLEI
jgi:diguanylate cyclase (GGDEF)-like protein